MTKAKLWKEIQKLLKEANVKDISKFEELLAPKTRKSDYIPPNVYGEHYCRKFNIYLPVEEFPQGEIRVEEEKKLQPACKLALKIIKTYRAKINDLKAQINDIMSKVLEGEISIEDGRKAKVEIQDEINNLETFRKSDFSKLDYEEEYKKFFE